MHSVGESQPPLARNLGGAPHTLNCPTVRHFSRLCVYDLCPDYTALIQKEPDPDSDSPKCHDLQGEISRHVFQLPILIMTT